jgi:hypothetical protein
LTWAGQGFLTKPKRRSKNQIRLLITRKMLQRHPSKKFQDEKRKNSRSCFTKLFYYV